MKILRREVYNAQPRTVYRVYPLGDLHIGAAACDELLLQEYITRIANDDNSYWIGLGDYCDFINLRDPRFSVSSLAPWVGRDELLDLAGAQRDHFIAMVEPINHKCLGLAMGNHEGSIQRYYERDIYGEMCAKIGHDLKMGMYGYIRLEFWYPLGPQHITINVHHGFTGGRLAGAKALAMQRWMWLHEADIFIMGHSHNTEAQREQTEGVDVEGNYFSRDKVGFFSGSFLQTVNPDGPTTYSEEKGYQPHPVGTPHIELTPDAEGRDRIRVVV